MVIKEQYGRTRVLRLANPPANVLNLSLLEALRCEIEQAAGDEGVGCLMLASAYPRYFSAGLDLQELLGLKPERRPDMFGALFGVYRRLCEFPKPSLACIQGSAILGGWIIAMGCDFRILSENTGRIALSEIRIGLSPGSELIDRLIRISSSPSLVKEMVLRGRTLRAEQALAGGFVDRLAPPDSIEAECLKEAGALCRLAPRAYASAKSSLWRIETAGVQTLRRESLLEFTRLITGPEAQEGIQAMLEKRAPRFVNAAPGEP